MLKRWNFLKTGFYEGIKAWLQLVRRYHPDLNPGDKQAEAKTKRINEAYDILSNDEKRKLYDEHGSYWLRH